MTLGLICYLASFFIVGLFISLRISRYKLFPNEFIFINAIAPSLFIQSFIFYFYLLNPRLGHWIEVCFILTSLPLLVLLIKELRQDHTSLNVIRQYLLPPLAIVGLIFIFYHSALYGCRTSSPIVDNRRFSTETFCEISNLPVDNALPQLFGDLTLQGHPRALIIDWTIADRPPVQMAATTPISDFTKKSNQHLKSLYYNMFSIFLQLSWVGVVWAILRFWKVNRSQSWLIILGFCLTQFFYLNSVYVWPKLLASSLVLAGIIPFLGGKVNDKRLRYLPIGITLITLGLMSHTGVLFTVLPVLLFLAYKIYIYERSKRNFKPLIISVVLALSVLIPWQVFKSAITSSDRLVKYHFADVTSYSDKRGTLTTIVDAYKNLSFNQWLNNKDRNLKVLVTGGTNVDLDCFVNFNHQKSLKECKAWRSLAFFSSIFALEAFVLGIVTIIMQAVKKNIDRVDIEIIAIVAGSLAFWVLAMFHPGATILHQGSYATMMLIFLILGKSLNKTSPYLLSLVVLLEAFIFFKATIFGF